MLVIADLLVVLGPVDHAPDTVFRFGMDQLLDVVASNGRVRPFERLVVNRDLKLVVMMLMVVMMMMIAMMVMLKRIWPFRRAKR